MNIENQVECLKNDPAMNVIISNRLRDIADTILEQEISDSFRNDVLKLKDLTKTNLNYVKNNSKEIHDDTILLVAAMNPFWLSAVNKLRRHMYVLN